MSQSQKSKKVFVDEEPLSFLELVVGGVKYFFHKFKEFFGIEELDSGKYRLRLKEIEQGDPDYEWVRKGHQWNSLEEISGDPGHHCMYYFSDDDRQCTYYMLHNSTSTRFYKSQSDKK